MNRSEFASAMMMTLIFTGTAFAADPPATGFRPASPAIKTAQGVVAAPVPVTLAPLKQKLTMQMVPLQQSSPLSPCVTIPAAIDSVHKKYEEAEHALYAAGLQGKFSLRISEYTGYYRPYVKGCCSTSNEYSVQDQQAAGCVSSESLNACLDKLTRSCIGKYVQSWQKVRQDAQKIQQDTKAVSTASDQLAQAMQQLVATLP
jgi:hypothetical protein